jgi:hypothetical protein
MDGTVVGGVWRARVIFRHEVGARRADPYAAIAACSPYRKLYSIGAKRVSKPKTRPYLAERYI